MATEKDITEMSDEEVLEYLEMLENQDDESEFDMSDDEIKSAEDKLKQDSQTGLSLLMQQRKVESANSKRRRILQIKNSYISNNRTVDLYKSLDKKILSQIIVAETADIQKSIDNAKKYVTKKIETCLNKKIPIPLKVAYKTYRQAFVTHPGFMYTACDAYGGGKLWIQPDVPYYFEQYSEMAVINKYFLHLRTLIDKNVQLYHRQAAKVLKLESKIATKLSRVNTVIGLLELDVDYYEMYMSIQLKQEEKIAQDQLTNQECFLYKQRYHKDLKP